jgi:hypothetical protein
MTKRDEAFEAMRKALENARVIINGAWPSSGLTIAGIKAEIDAALRLAEEGATAIKDGKQ